ncbi:MAG: hypothetical protein ACYTEQ_00850 [Planctomycetota bacterium]|jgi:hypothetical protein
MSGTDEKQCEDCAEYRSPACCAVNERAALDGKPDEMCSVDKDKWRPKEGLPPPIPEIAQQKQTFKAVGRSVADAFYTSDADDKMTESVGQEIAHQFALQEANAAVNDMTGAIESLVDDWYDLARELLAKSVRECDPAYSFAAAYLEKCAFESGQAIGSDE